MLPIDPLWLYVAVPTVVVSVLVMIKLMQRKESRNIIRRPKRAQATSQVLGPRNEATRTEHKSEVNPEETSPETSGRPKPKNCVHYLGYLYLKKAPDQSPIPTECYGCQMLLKCLYSPNVIEKVYGQ